MKNIINLFLFLLLASNLLGQMEEGDYPFQLYDSLIFSNKQNCFQIDTNQKPEGFISKMEEGYTLAVAIKKEENKEYETISKEIHEKTNNRDFIAGITNYSSDTVFIPIQDESLISIIEAKNSNGIWEPIQFWPISGCGNSYYSEAIPQNHTLLFTVKKNYGNIKTKMRIRLHGTDTIFVSEEFIGTVDNSMFKFDKNIIENYRYIMCDSIFFLDSPHFGNSNNENDFKIVIIEEE